MADGRPSETTKGLKQDPFQLNNVVSDLAYDPAKTSLREALLDWIEKTDGDLPEIADD